MQLELYKNISSSNTINKELTLINTLDIHLSQHANLSHTQFIIHNNDQLKELNYAKMLDRCYFVQVQTLNNNKFLSLTLDEDVLETYKKEILASTQDVIEKSSAGNVKQNNVSSETISKIYQSNKSLTKGKSIFIVTSGENFYNKEAIQ